MFTLNHRDFTSDLKKQYGLLLSQSDLAKLLKRPLPSLRQSLWKGATPTMRNIRACSCRIGRATYYPTETVAKIIFDQGGIE